jgi:hypothetical protein
VLESITRLTRRVERTPTARKTATAVGEARGVMVRHVKSLRAETSGADC